MLEELFQPPIIGPFVESNGRKGDGHHTGARITWTAAGEAYRLDVIRTGVGPFWYDTLGLDQTPEIDFDDFCWFCFKHSTRLGAFLNELQPYIRPSSGAPTNAPAGRWLHPKLVERDFTLGIAKFRKDSVRVPVVWVFGGNASEYGARHAYAKVGEIDWSPSFGARLNLSECCCWGTGALALNRLLGELVGTIPSEPLLTEAGTARMQEVHQNGMRRSTQIFAPARLQAGDREIASRLRRSLEVLSRPLKTEAARDVDLLTEKAYSGLLRTCLTAGNENPACALLAHRKLPEYGRQHLIERLIDLEWLKVWEVCAPEAERSLTESRYGGYNELMQRVLKRGNPKLFSAILSSLSNIPFHTAQNILEDALQLGREDIVDAITGTPAVKPHLQDALLQCFTHGLEAHRGPVYCKRADLAMYLLERGVRPLRAIKPDDWFGPRRGLLEQENLPVLKRAFELEPPTRESVTRMLSLALTKTDPPVLTRSYPLGLTAVGFPFQAGMPLFRVDSEEVDLLGGGDKI